MMKPAGIVVAGITMIGRWIFYRTQASAISNLSPLIRFCHSLLNFDSPVSLTQPVRW